MIVKRGSYCEVWVMTPHQPCHSLTCQLNVWIHYMHVSCESSKSSSLFGCNIKWNSNKKKLPSLYSELCQPWPHLGFCFVLHNKCEEMFSNKRDVTVTQHKLDDVHPKEELEMMGYCMSSNWSSHFAESYSTMTTWLFDFSADNELPTVFIADWSF